MPSPTQDIGAECERLAEGFLVRAGYSILERNWRGGGGEIDRIAFDSEVLVFVEVRSRKSDSGGRPEETIRTTKQTRLIRAAMAYLALRDGSVAVRFDVVSVSLFDGKKPVIQLQRAAFDATDFASRCGLPML